MPPRAPGSAPVALLLMACVAMVMATQASAAATWKVELVPTPITRDAYEATTTLPATCFKISQTGKCGSNKCCCNAAPPSTLTIKNVARACARTNKAPAFTVDGIAQEGAKSARYFGKGAAKLSGANSNSPSLTLTLPVWATGQTERLVCISTGTGACGTFPKICNNRASCPLTLSGTGSCSKTSKCTSATTSVKTAPIATAVHAIVVAFKDAAEPCAKGSPDHFEKVANAFEKDLRGHFVALLGNNQAVPLVDFKPQFCGPEFSDAAKAAGASNAAPEPIAHGMAGFVTVTGAPDLIDDALKLMDTDTLSHPTAVQVMCQAGGGASCGFYGVATGIDLPGVDTSAYDTSSNLDKLKANTGTGFNVLKYNPPGDYIDAEASSIDVGNWLTSGRVYDYDSIAAECAGDSCFSTVPVCTNAISVSTSASSAERQNSVAASASVTGKYAGVTGSASGSFNQAQEQMESSDSLAVTTSANCVIRTFKLPTDTAKFSDAFIRNVGSALQHIADAKKLGADPNEARDNILGGLNAIYNNYGTHVPSSLAYGGFMRLELLISTSAITTKYKSNGELQAAASHVAADFAAKASTSSAQTTEMLKSQTGYSFLHVPAMPRVPLTPVGAGYAIDANAWIDLLLTQASDSSLYPKIIATTALADLFREAGGGVSNAALKFGALTEEQTKQFATLATAFEAFVTNDVELWAQTGLPMPQLLDEFNYFANGKCVSSSLVVRVNQRTAFGSSFRCVTCVRDVGTLPTDPSVSKSYAPSTASCTIDAAGSLESVASVCKPPTACKGNPDNKMCRDIGNGIRTGRYQTEATCDGDVQCLSEADCTSNSNLDEWYGGHAAGYNARCINNNCVQCGSNKDCNDTHACRDYNCDHACFFCRTDGTSG